VGSQVGAREILAKGDLIAQRRRQQVRIGIAPVVDRRLVIELLRSSTLRLAVSAIRIAGTQERRANSRY
jgi:hypothetical protein